MDKSSGIRPIGVGEVLRCIIGKAILTGLKLDILNVTGYQQICAGLESGCEVAVHAVVNHFEEDTTHGFIKIDASNVFNSINRTLILHNINIVCPEIATYINNCLSDCNWIRTHNHLVRKRTLNHLAKLTK